LANPSCRRHLCPESYLKYGINTTFSKLFAISNRFVFKKDSFPFTAQWDKIPMCREREREGGVR
jgi:hypothetical protein